MRIITGSARGAVLTTLEGEATRPTSSKVKEAIFSSIQFDLEGRRFLDLFAGSGQMGLEALSRGAEKAVMVDNSREAIEIMKANAQKNQPNKIKPLLYLINILIIKKNHAREEKIQKHYLLKKEQNNKKCKVNKNIIKIDRNSIITRCNNQCKILRLCKNM